jgi:hypothetical protein
MRVTRALTLAILVPVVAGGTATAGAAGTAADDPQALLKDAAASLAKVRSLHLSASTTDADGTFRFTADVLASGNANIAIRQGDEGTLRLRKVSSSTYLRGDAAYWKSAGGEEGAELAKELGGRWVKVPKADAKEFSGLFTEVLPKRLASCLAVPGAVGTLTDGGSATVGGRKATVLVDAGDKPGTSPGKLFVAASGAPLPLRILQTGPVKPGGKATSCSDGEDTSTASDFRLSKFNRKLTIRAPKDVVKAPSTGGEEGSAAV